MNSTIFPTYFENQKMWLQNLKVPLFICDVNCFPYIWSEKILTICFDLQSDLGRPTIDLAGVYDIGALGYEVSLLDVWRYLHLANINDWIKKSFNRTSCLPIQSLIILVINKWSSNFDDQLYDYRLNLTPLSPIIMVTIIYRFNIKQ